MQELYSVNPYTTGAVARPERRMTERNESERSKSPNQPADSVELSDAAANYDPQTAAEAAMQKRIATIRTQIAADTYLTDDKLNAVVDRLFEELSGN